MEQGALPRRVVEWFSRASALRAARADRPRPGDAPEAAARQATLLLEAARRVVEPGEPLPDGSAGTVALALYRDAIYWALVARRADAREPPADLRALWDASNPQLAGAAAGRGAPPCAPPENEESTALQRTLFGDVPARGLAADEDDVARVRRFAEALVRQLDAPRDRIARLLFQRWRRCALLGAAALLLAIGGRIAALGPDLAAGKSFRVSSTWSGWKTCLARQSDCWGLMFQTEAEDDPWVEIDLGSPQRIRRIEVLNRETCCVENATPLVAEISSDRAAWTQVARSDRDFGSWKATFPPRTARYVRLRVPRRTTLHLQSIKVR